MTAIELNEMYKNNPTFKEYVDKYSRSHRTLPEDALKCMVVKNYANYIKGGK